MAALQPDNGFLREPVGREGSSGFSRAMATAVVKVKAI